MALYNVCDIHLGSAQTSFWSFC